MYVTKCLKSIGLNIDTVSLSDPKAKVVLIKSIKLKLAHLYNNEWKVKVTSGTNPKYNSKLRTYATFKQGIYFETYLTSTNIKARELFAKLRLSDHKLAIESDRWRKIKPENRLCNICQNTSNSVEDEFHFVLKCNKYSTIRKELFKKIAESSRSFLDLTEKDKFNYIMSYKCSLVHILKYINLVLLLEMNKQMFKPISNSQLPILNL